MNEFDGIISYEATKEELVRIADFLKNTERYHNSLSCRAVLTTFAARKRQRGLPW